MIGIYKIENKASGKLYIGQSIDIESRWYSHIHDLDSNCHSNRHLQNAWNKYGSNNFQFTVIEKCSEDKLTEREQYWIDFYGGVNSDKNYNNRDAGNCGSPSIETREKLRQINLGKSAWNKGLTAETDERIKKYASKLAKRSIPEEQKYRISETVKLRHKEGIYDYKVANEKKIETRKRNGTIRKDKGVIRGKRSKEIGIAISNGKLNANARKKELGLPLRNQVKKPIPMKISICTVCGKEFEQRRCHYKKTCSETCKRIQISLTNKETKNGSSIVSSKVQTEDLE